MEFMILLEMFGNGVKIGFHPLFIKLNEKTQGLILQGQNMAPQKL